MSYDLKKLYVNLEDFKLAIGDDGEDYDDLYLRAIDAASRRIDLWTGRHFYVVDSDTRVNRPETTYYAYVGDFVDPTDITIKTDDEGSGTYETTWVYNVDWIAEPFSQYNDVPFNRILAVGAKEFILGSRRPTVQGSGGPWGWSEFPSPVIQSAQILSISYFKSKDFTGGDIGMPGFGVGGTNVRATDTIELARDLIKDYVIPPGTAISETPSVTRRV